MTSSCTIENNTSLEADRLLNTDRQFAAMSLRSGAAEAFKTYLAEDALALSDGQHPTLGRSAIYAAMEPKQSNYELDWVPQKAEVSQAEDLGWTWGTFTLSYTDERGNKKVDHGKYLNIWKRKDDGSWAVAVDMGNSNPAPKN